MKDRRVATEREQAEAAVASDPRSSGAALILVLLVVTLLYIIVAELVTRSNFDHMAAENQGVEARMREAMRLGLEQVFQDLAEDTGGESSESAGGAPGASGLSGLTGGAGAPGGAGGQGEAGGEEQPDVGDSSRDVWYRPKSVEDANDIVVYAFVEDENRKLNVLSLLSPDEEFAELSRQRLIRLIDKLWENTEQDVSAADAELWVRAMLEWMKGRDRNDDRPRPPLKTNKEGDDTTLPLSLDEFRLLQPIPEDVFEDRVVRDMILPGLCSVLTVHTSIGVEAAPASSESGAAAGGQNQAPSAGTQPRAPATAAGREETPAPTPLEPGPRININTASRAVLRALEDESAVPNAVIEAILRYRNEVDEESEKNKDTSTDESELLAEDHQKKLKYFRSVGDLEQVKEWSQLPASEGKERFLAMLTTSSNVFTVHLAGLNKRDEEGLAFSLTKARCVVARVEDGEKMAVEIIVPLRRWEGVRVLLHDFPEEAEERWQQESETLSAFDAETAAWTPFLPEFFDPEKRLKKHQ